MIFMVQTETKLILTARQLKFANLRYRDELNDEEIAEECGISRSTVYRWDEVPEIQEEMTRLAKADSQKAQRILGRASVKAAKRLEVLADTKTSDPPLAETGRKAACDILESTELKKEQGAVNINIVDKKLEVSETKNEH